jgi:protein phosphatase
MSTLVLPDPSLVILVGAAGAGKSTLAARLFAADEIVSSDALRAAVSGNEADQRASAVAFSILHRTLERRLATGEMTVIDATNTKREHRRPLIARARVTATPIVAIVLDLPSATVLTRNAGRTGRIVDPTVVHRHLEAIRRTVDQDLLAAEGIDHVVLLQTTTAADNLQIERRRPARPREPALDKRQARQAKAHP